MEYYRSEVTKLLSSWVGLKEADGSYKKILDIYNSYKGPFPRGVKMQVGWAWCAATWSAAAIKLGYTDIMPIEISCIELINRAKTMGCWKENDGYIPKPGDAILYDWQDNGVGDNVGVPDHIGTVETVNQSAGYFVVIEGNYQDSVRRRTVSINGRYIRGFITPKYTAYKKPTTSKPEPEKKKTEKEVAHEVIAGSWGNGESRRKKLVAAGYKPEKIQELVNEILNGDANKGKKPEGKVVKSTVWPKKFNHTLKGKYKTTADLYCRNDIGSNKKALCLIPKNTTVEADGYYDIDGSGALWYRITAKVNGTTYIGFSHSKYLKKK